LADYWWTTRASLARSDSAWDSAVTTRILNLADAENELASSETVLCCRDFGTAFDFEAGGGEIAQLGAPVDRLGAGDCGRAD